MTPSTNALPLSLPSVSSDKAARSRQLALAAARTADDHRGRDIVVLDVRHLTCMFDYFVIVTGTSRRHLHALAEEIDHKLEKDLGDRRLGREGFTDSRWILLDYGNIVVHLFDEEARKYFSLEELWAEGTQVSWQSAPGLTTGHAFGGPSISTERTA